MTTTVLKLFTGFIIGDLSILIPTITSSANSIITTINNISNLKTNTQNIKDIITKLQNIDLEFTITIISQFIEEQKNKNLNVSITKTLEGVSLTLIKINEQLDEFYNLINVHNKKWFSSYRTFECNNNIEILDNYNKILKNRYKILFELLKINQHEK